MIDELHTNILYISSRNILNYSPFKDKNSTEELKDIITRIVSHYEKYEDQQQINNNEFPLILRLPKNDTNGNSEQRSNLKISAKLFMYEWNPDIVIEAVQFALTELDISNLDQLIIAFPEYCRHKTKFEDFKPVWAKAETLCDQNYDSLDNNNTLSHSMMDPTNLNSSYVCTNGEHCNKPISQNLNQNSINNNNLQNSVNDISSPNSHDTHKPCNGYTFKICNNTDLKNNNNNLCCNSHCDINCNETINYCNNVMKNNPIPKVVHMGVSDLNKSQLEALTSWAKVKPSSNQINSVLSCIVPEDLTNYADENGVVLLTHNDKYKVLSDTDFREGIKPLLKQTYEQWKLNFVLRYIITIKSREVIKEKGYLIKAIKIAK